MSISVTWHCLGQIETLHSFSHHGTKIIEFHQHPHVHLDTLNYNESKFSFPKLVDSCFFLYFPSQISKKPQIC